MGAFCAYQGSQKLLYRYRTKLIFVDDSEDCVLEVDSGSFKWKGWMPKKDRGGKDSKSDEGVQDALQNPEYDIVEQPFCLENINLKIQKASIVLLVFYVSRCL